MRTAFVRKIRSAGTIALGGACLLLGAAHARNQATAAGENLYQDVTSHAAAIKWSPAPADNYPSEACNYLNACPADGSAPKQFALPLATVDGHRVARAVYLVKTRDPKQLDAVVFEHQSASQTYFFRLAPNGMILKSAYLERGGNWLLIANELGQPIFNKDAADWHAALTKAASPAPKPAQ
jgi:hypothetical protein